ncbi:MAG TPA: hypothetical protein VD970_17735, partial [Acetobacteraceae bacterium]|nr:hypothetical protein [Acetobacteraceae bacterium]
REIASDGRTFLVLDASADQQLVKVVWGPAAQIETVGARRFAHFVQVMGRSFSMTALGLGQRKECDTTRQRVEFLRTALAKAVALHGEGRVGCITYKKLVEPLRGVDGVMFSWLGAARGLNAMAELDALLVVGRLRPGPEAVEDQARALARLTEQELNLAGAYEKEVRGIDVRGADAKGIKVEVHPDPLVQALLEQVREREVEQMLDRIRPVRRQGNPPVIYILSNEVLDLTVDRIMDTDVWLAMVAAQAAAARGEAPTVSLAWLEREVPVLLQRADGQPLSAKQAERQELTLNEQFLAEAVRLRLLQDEGTSRVRGYIPPLSLHYRISGALPEGQRILRISLAGAGLADDMPSWQRAASYSVGLPISALVEASKDVLSEAERAINSEMNNDPLWQRLLALAAYRKALRTAMEQAGLAETDWQAADIEEQAETMAVAFRTMEPRALDLAVGELMRAAWKSALSRLEQEHHRLLDAGGGPETVNERNALLTVLETFRFARELPPEQRSIMDLDAILEWNPDSHPYFVADWTSRPEGHIRPSAAAA